MKILFIIIISIVFYASFVLLNKTNINTFIKIFITGTLFYFATILFNYLTALFK